MQSQLLNSSPSPERGGSSQIVTYFCWVPIKLRGASAGEADRASQIRQGQASILPIGISSPTSPHKSRHEMRKKGLDARELILCGSGTLASASRLTWTIRLRQPRSRPTRTTLEILCGRRRAHVPTNGQDPDHHRLCLSPRPRSCPSPSVCQPTPSLCSTWSA